MQQQLNHRKKPEPMQDFLSIRPFFVFSCNTVDQTTYSFTVLFYPDLPLAIPMLSRPLFAVDALGFCLRGDNEVVLCIHAFDALCG